MWTVVHWVALVWAVGSAIYVGVAWSRKVGARRAPDAAAQPSTFLLARVGMIAVLLALMVDEDPSVGPWWLRVGGLVVAPMALAFGASWTHERARSSTDSA
ncbi:hypothetical protein [Sanguibacter massiliensis]|uniref:hypothetical protein n=1 Tax=Sanguibacter massiliensis TaxID=1973217 RepID=UPI000C84A2F7|nr:hypothetical protein [Sanguibacter massiliensis]